MNRRTHRQQQSFFLFLILFVGVLAGCGTSPQTLQAGAAQVDITPEDVVGVTLEGYLPPHAADRMQDPLSARCLVVDDGDTSIALVTLDLLGIFYADAAQIAAAISDATGIPPEQILIHATHTHSAPSMLFLDVRPEYKQQVAANVVSCVVEATAALEPTVAHFASGETEGLAIDRRHPERALKREIVVVEFRDQNDEVIADLVNFGSHPVVLGPDNTAITPDYPYYLREALEEARGGVTLFFNRDMGNVNPPAIRAEDVYDRTGGTFEMAQTLGQALAEESLKILSRAESHPLQIKVRTQPVLLPVDNAALLQMAGPELAEGIQAAGGLPSSASIIDLGPAQIMAFPGEALTSFREDVEGLLPGPYKLFFSQTNDSAGYIIPADEWNPQSGHEEVMAVGPDVAPVLEEKYREIAQELFAGQP